MNPDPDKPDQPKKSVTKNWKSQTKRTADPIKKLKDGVDAQKSWARLPWGKKLHRTDIPWRVLPILREIKRRSLPREAILHSLTTLIFDHAFSHAPGRSVNLEEAWQKIIVRFQRLRPGVVHYLNNSESRSAFFWQIAGHVEGFCAPVNQVIKQIVICRVKRGRSKGKLVPFYELENGSIVPIPKHPQPDWPVFLVLGDYWSHEPICHWTVANMKFKWPCPAVERLIPPLFWEPPIRIFRERKRKK
jgi:hypothetical protein